MSSTPGILSEDVDSASRMAVETALQASPVHAQDKARFAITQARTHLAGILARSNPTSILAMGPQAEASALTQAVVAEAEHLREEYGYTREQAFAVKLSELARFQMVAEIAGDSQMLENIRRVKAFMIQGLGVPSSSATSAQLIT